MGNTLQLLSRESLQEIDFSQSVNTDHPSSPGGQSPQRFDETLDELFSFSEEFEEIFPVGVAQIYRYIIKPILFVN